MHNDRGKKRRSTEMEGETIYRISTTPVSQYHTPPSQTTSSQPTQEYFHEQSEEENLCRQFNQLKDEQPKSISIELRDADITPNIGNALEATLAKHRVFSIDLSSSCYTASLALSSTATRLTNHFANHPYLRSLNLTHTNFFSDKYFLILMTALEKNPILTYLSLVGIPHLDFSKVATLLQKNRSLQTLDLSQTTVEENSIVILANSLKQNKTLRTLGLMACPNFKDPSPLFHESIPLHSLDISYNQLDEKNTSIWAKQLSEDKTALTTLHVNEYSWTPSRESYITLLQALTPQKDRRSNTTLRKFSVIETPYCVYSNGHTKYTCAELELIRNNKTLYSLSLTQNLTTNRKLKFSFFSALRENKSLLFFSPDPNQDSNQAIEKILSANHQRLHHWMRIVILISAMRAYGKHPLGNSIFSLMAMITAMADNSNDNECELSRVQLR